MTELTRTYKLTDSGAWGWVTEEAEGGGGGSLPSWWTVDNTPGSESVDFAGAVTISPSDPVNPLETIAAPAGFAAGSSIFTQWTTPEDGVVHSFDAYGDLNMYGSIGNGQAAIFLKNRDDPFYSARVGAGYPGGHAFYATALDPDTGGPMTTLLLTSLGAVVMRKHAADAPAPDAEEGTLFVRENGGGKAEMCARFGSGAVQVIATEP